MNQQQALSLLRELLLALGADSFCVVPEFFGELLALIRNSGIEAQFFRMLSARLRLLVDAPEKAFLRSSEFEAIGGGIYSLHVDSGQHNTRILYGILSDKRAVLLQAFDERSGHKRTSYSGHIPIAEQRLKEALEHE